MRKFSFIFLLGFFMSFLSGCAGLFFLNTPFAIVSACFSTLISGVLMYSYHAYNKEYYVSSISERRKLYVVYPAILVVSLTSLIMGGLHKEMPVLSIWALLSLMSFLHFDTFRPFLTKFGKRKPLVKDVRGNYHISLFLLHFAIGAWAVSISQLIPMTQRLHASYQSHNAAIIFGIIGLMFILAMAVSWYMYRSEHAAGERIAIAIYGDDFIDQIRDGKLTALPKKEFEKYVNP
jgi:hypothetical protein